MKKTLTLLTSLFLAGTASADLVTGYTLGATSQLLTTNGGAGTTLFHDTAALGGSNVSSTGTESFNSVLLDGSGLWSIGQTVSITGVALPHRGASASPFTQSGTFTFNVRQGAGGSGASGAGGLSLIGSTTANYTAPAGTTATAEVIYANFDTPVSFVVDANSTTIGINFTSTSTIQYKSGVGSGLQRYNFSNGNNVDTMAFSVAGTVVPEPSTFSLLGLGVMVAVAARRKRK